MKDFVPYDLAVKLKEKGFDYPCIAHYDINKELKVVVREPIFWHSDVLSYTDAPTISQVLKWLREKKKLHIELWTIGKKPIKWCHTITTLNHVGETQGWSTGKRKDSYEAAALEGIEYVLDNLI